MTLLAPMYTDADASRLRTSRAEPADESVDAVLSFVAAVATATRVPLAANALPPLDCPLDAGFPADDALGPYAVSPRVGGLDIDVEDVPGAALEGPMTGRGVLEQADAGH